jgi:hypothetical protein
MVQSESSQGGVNAMVSRFETVRAAAGREITEQAAKSVDLSTDRKAQQRAARANEARRASGRRRGVDPTTCERDYTADEIEFLKAIEQYKRDAGRPYPTWGEVLMIARELGYLRA